MANLIDRNFKRKESRKNKLNKNKIYMGDEHSNIFSLIDLDKLIG